MIYFDRSIILWSNFYFYYSKRIMLKKLWKKNTGKTDSKLEALHYIAYERVYKLNIRS